jgi:hypothetical protein
MQTFYPKPQKKRVIKSLVFTPRMRLQPCNPRGANGLCPLI